MPAIYVSTPEAIWTVTVGLGIILNSVFLGHSIVRCQYMSAANPERPERPSPSIVEAAKGLRESDAWRLAAQILFLPSVWIALESPNGPITLRGWIFTCSFLLVEISLVFAALRSAIRFRRIARLRLLERR